MTLYIVSHRWSVRVIWGESSAAGLHCYDFRQQMDYGRDNLTSLTWYVFLNKY